MIGRPRSRHQGSSSHSIPRCEQVVEHLVGLRPRRRASSSISSSMSATSKLLTPQWRIRPSRSSCRNALTVSPSGTWPAPVQEVEVEAVGAQPPQAALARGDRPVRGSRCAGSTLLTRNTSSRRPSIASADEPSAAPSPYISAVSISVRPRSRPGCSASISTASGCRPCPMCHVPMPRAGIVSPEGNGTAGIIMTDIRRVVGHAPPSTNSFSTSSASTRNSKSSSSPSCALINVP